MTAVDPLLTIVLETDDELDRESTMYRRILAARLRHEQDYAIRVVRGPLATRDIEALCREIQSPYIVFMHASHQISIKFLPDLITYLADRRVYMAEPTFYSAAIPKDISVTKIDNPYHYARDTDITGVVFNRGRLLDALESLGDLDRSALYLGYRLYWSIGQLNPLPIGYSRNSDTKSAIGINVDPRVERLLPLIKLASPSVQTMVLRYLVLYLRRLRATKKTLVKFTHLKDIAVTFELNDVINLPEPLHPFEAAWITWLLDPSKDTHLYKMMSAGDAYLNFKRKDGFTEDEVPLYRIDIGGEIVTIAKEYKDHDLNPAFNRPAAYDFYSNPITTKSTIIFFDRPKQADDNAEHLYAHFKQHYPQYTEAYFALNPTSKDWPRLEAAGFKLISIFTKEFYEKFLVSDLVVSSQIYSLRHMNKSLANSRFVYLQHGVQLNDMTDWVVSKMYDVFVATGKLEADYLGKVAPRETINSGLPRLETLTRVNPDQRKILFMPTWRFGLHQASAEHFLKSEYFHAIDNLLSDPRLLEFLEKTDRVLEVKLHPNVEKRATSFRFSERVYLCEASYRDAISSAEFVLTDYSSVVLDASFIGIPVAYYQWDAADFFEEQPYERRLDYKTAGLGPVFEKHNQIIEHILTEKYLLPSSKFDARRNRFYEGVDPKRINEKIIERMLSL